LQDEVELGGDCKTQPSLIWIKAVGIEDGNYETTCMQPSVIVWNLETVPHERPRGCRAAGVSLDHLVGNASIKRSESSSSSLNCAWSKKSNACP
jgi:hypothetical protein